MSHWVLWLWVFWHWVLRPDTHFLVSVHFKITSVLGLSYFQYPGRSQFSNKFSFSKGVWQKFLVFVFCWYKRFLRKLSFFAFLFFESKNLKFHKWGFTWTFWKSNRKINLINMQEKDKFLPAVHGTIRGQFVKLVGKVFNKISSTLRENLTTFQRWNLFEHFLAIEILKKLLVYFPNYFS